MIRILLADDHAIVRQSIARMLADTGEIQVVGEAANGNEALEQVCTLKPDVLVLDMAMPQRNGLETAREVHQYSPGTRIVILSMHADEGLARKALQNGALGYVLKQDAFDELLVAIRTASRGGIYLSPGVSKALLPLLNAASPEDPLERLSPREREVIQLILDGCTTKEAAERLCTSIKTVEKQRRSAMHKLGVHDIAGLVRLGIHWAEKS